MTLLLFLVLVAVCSYWALQILAPRPAIAPSASLGDSAAAPNLAPAVTLFGSPNAVTAGTAAPSSNIQVSGVLEAGPEGVVILSVDGKPGAAYAVGASLSEGTTVVSVALGKVVLNQRGRLIELKTPDRASLSVLSSGVGKARVSGDGSIISPVQTRTATAAPLPAPLPPAPLPSPSLPAAPPPPQFQAPQPPQPQQLQQIQTQQQQAQQQQQFQQQQQQQLQQQQVYQQQQAQQQQAQGQQQQGQPMLQPPGQAPLDGTMPGQQPVPVQQSDGLQQPAPPQ